MVDSEEIKWLLDGLTDEQLARSYLLLKIILYSSDSDKDLLFKELEKRFHQG